MAQPGPRTFVGRDRRCHPVLTPPRAGRRGRLAHIPPEHAAAALDVRPEAAALGQGLPRTPLPVRLRRPPHGRTTVRNARSLPCRSGPQATAGRRGARPPRAGQGLRPPAGPDPAD
ncbi:hypothetical protein BJP39_26180 [Streptomyces sp. CC77]|nr:hypothetical protein BJP39_26180 [Streptomyces sp. CC77]